MKGYTKGLSAVIASVLLVAITVSAAFFVMSWSQGFFSQQTETVGTRAGQGIDCAVSKKEAF